MHWIEQLLDLLPIRPPPDDGQETFARKERDLRQRYERLSQEVDVIQRVNPDEEARQ